MKFHRVLWQVAFLVVAFCGAAWAQTTGSITGTVKDPSGAAISGAAVTVTSPERGITRNTTTNSTGEYNESALPQGTYDVIVSAAGFKKFQAKGVVLDVAQKARVDVALEVGTATTEVVVEGANVAQVETQSSELAGTVTGKEITQLELNGRNFTTLVSLVPGVSNQTGMDEPQVGINGSVAFSMNGGRTEYNNWELDGGDNMDNGSNGTLNVYPSVDAISEFKVLTSNYGAQYGRNGSGTVEVETKSGTRAFHGDAYEFVRNDALNANNYFNSVYRGGNGKVPPYKKNDYGYTVGGPVYIPGVYNKDKQKTFFFWSEEWRHDRLPQNYNSTVPYSAERTGNFADVCPTVAGGATTTFQHTDSTQTATYFPDCPGASVVQSSVGTSTLMWNTFAGNQLPAVTPQAQALLPLIPVGTSDVPGASNYNTNVTLPTTWREELVHIDHNINAHNRATFRFIHDSWSTLEAGSIWDTSQFPTSQTFFNGPGVSVVARLTSTISPTLLNEFVASYTTDHIGFHAVGVYKIPSGFSMGYLYNNGAGGKLPAINVGGTVGGSFGGATVDPEGVWPEGPYNSNPTYTYRDNMTKIIGRHNLTFGAYVVAAQKNELSSVQVNGSLGFSRSSDNFNTCATPATCGFVPLGTGNAFADMLLGNINSFSQGSNQLKFYNRYKIVEPYAQDDWRVTDRLTLNLGLRISLFGTYRDRYKHAYNWDPAVYLAGKANAAQLAPDGTLTPGVGNPLLGLVQCGGPGGVVNAQAPSPLSLYPGATVGANSNAGCLQGHLFNPAPRIGFAYDLFGNGKTALRGGYGMFYEHANGNEANTEGMEGQTSPLIQSGSINDIQGYGNIGAGGGGGPAPSGTLSFLSAVSKATWPYMQQWHFDIQHEFAGHSVMTVSYVGSKGTHLGLQRDLNQLYPVAASLNPYHAGQPITATDCTAALKPGSSGIYIDPLTNIATATPGSGTTYTTAQTGGWANNLAVACGVVGSADFYRSFQGVHHITRLENTANSIYHALQVSARKSVGALNLTAAYTWSHSIDDSSDRYDGTFVNSYNPGFTRASSNFDERHMFNAGWVYDIPLFKKSGITHTLLGGWEYSGIATFATGTPINVTNGTTYGDNAGVGNGVGTGSFPDLIGDPNGSTPASNSTNYPKFWKSPGAYGLPTGLTFGTAGRNSARNPGRESFDMAMFKHFAIKESMAFEFRAEAFNIFNHTQWSGLAGTSMSCTGASAPYSAGASTCVGAPSNSNFLELNSAHLARVVQFGAKFIF